MYKTVVIEYSPKADDMAQKVEEKSNEMLQDGYELITMSITGTAKANEMLQDGYELITMSITGTAKAILVFKN